jgi:hypothetical protein
LLNFFFSELSSLSKHTELLESLDWSSEKVQEVLDICQKSISEMSNNFKEYSSPDSFRQKIYKDLSLIINDDQIKIVLDILNSTITQSLEGIMSDGN